MSCHGTIGYSQKEINGLRKPKAEFYTFFFFQGVDFLGPELIEVLNASFDSNLFPTVVPNSRQPAK